MPTTRLIAMPMVPARRRHSEALEQERAQMRNLLQQARKTAKVLELTLSPEERAETIKMHCRTVARQAGWTVQFQTGRLRPYRNRKGREDYEAEVLLVFVTPRNRRRLLGNHADGARQPTHETTMPARRPPVGARGRLVMTWGR